MPKGGELRISYSNKSIGASEYYDQLELEPGDYVSITVSDSGEGIAPELISQVFEPFFTTKDTGKGTGLGLSMVFGFAKQSGGHVSIESELCKGTSITLLLPRCKGQ